jgi:stearoyl-CoA desaturase (delta-9 desaturase)
MNKNIFKHSNLYVILFHHLLIIYGIATYGFNIWIALAILLYTTIYNTVINGELIHLRMAHNKYKDGILEKFVTIYSLISGGAGSPLSFAYIHRMHHAHVDTELDPHSPKYLGNLRVWFLFWKIDKINPNYIKDYMCSRFQVWMHRHWFILQITTLIIFWIINPLIVVFVISPTMVMTLHYSGFINVNGHLKGKTRNIPEIIFTQPLSWKHDEHHKKYS